MCGIGDVVMSVCVAPQKYAFSPATSITVSMSTVYQLRDEVVLCTEFCITISVHFASSHGGRGL